MFSSYLNIKKPGKDKTTSLPFTMSGGSFESGF